MLCVYIKKFGGSAFGAMFRIYISLGIAFILRVLILPNQVSVWPPSIQVLYYLYNQGP